jgi:phospholipid/cholesterol/gamma-HCH transport system substrate-binding protein
VIALGIAIFMAGVFTLGGQKKTFASTITLYAVFTDINGLQKGNNVWYSGVKVGTIRSVKFNPDSKVLVALNVEERVLPFIRKTTHAKVSSDGLIGNRIVVIYGGNTASPPVAEGDTLSVENLTSTEGMMDTLQLNNRNLLTITQNVKVLTSQILAGQGTAGQILMKDDMANSMVAALNSLNQASRNAEHLTQTLNSYASGLHKPGTFANDLVNDTAVFAGLRRSVADIHSAANNINEVSRNLNSTDNTIGVLLNDPKAAQDIQQTLHNLNVSTAKLDTNMEALKHNWLLRGYFKKQEKEQKKAAEGK